MSEIDIVSRLNDSLSFVKACKYPDGLDCHCDPAVGHQCELCADKSNLQDAIKEIERLRSELSISRLERSTDDVESLIAIGTDALLKIAYTTSSDPLFMSCVGAVSDCVESMRAAAYSNASLRAELDLAQEEISRQKLLRKGMGERIDELVRRLRRRMKSEASFLQEQSEILRENGAEIDRLTADLSAAQAENERLRASLVSAGHYLSDDCYQKATAKDIIDSALRKDGEG